MARFVVLVGMAALGFAARAGVETPPSSMVETPPSSMVETPPSSMVETPPPLTGLEVMARVDARPRGRDQTAHSRWRLVDADGGERVRETRSFWRDARRDGNGLRAQRLIVFEAPPRIRETAFLVWSREDPTADDDRWIYLPALRKVRRIAGGDRGNRFLGTDFSYEDLSERDLAADEHELLRSEEREDVLHHVVQATPVDPHDPYSKRVLWIDPTHWIERRIEYYDRKGELEKVLTIEWQESSGIQTWKRLDMVHRQRDHRTVVEVLDVAFDTALGPEDFTETTLRLGGP